MNQVDTLKATIATLLEKIKDLEARLSKFEHPKNSKNSSIPPSKDDNRKPKNQSLREKSGKKVGGQHGHEGHTLQMCETPDVVEKLQSNFCSKCGNDITSIEGELVDMRQMIDIPPIQAFVTQYQLYKKTCACGHCNKPAFPTGINAPVQYGTGIESMAAYLHTRQYLPFERIQEYFHQVLHITISKGTIQNILMRMAENATPFYDKIKAQIEQSTYVGGDETSLRINGKKSWLWTLQNESYTFLHTSDNRGFTTLKSLFPNGLPNTIIGHDAYSTWFQLQAKGHQLCLAHLHRDLNYFKDIYPTNNWSEKVKELFYQATDTLSHPKPTTDYFKTRLDELLQDADVENFTLLKPFVKRLTKYKQAMFLFLEHQFVPPDNNGSERAIRNAKVKTKISGQFKTIQNANIFAILRSVMDTLVKQKQQIMPNLILLANCRPE